MRRTKARRAAAMVEYAILVGIIGIGGIGIARRYSSSLGETFNVATLTVDTQIAKKIGKGGSPASSAGGAGGSSSGEGAGATGENGDGTEAGPDGVPRPRPPR